MDKIIVAEWLKYANNDLETVHILNNHQPLQVEIICYHCQQAAEKALKAFLLFKDMEPPKTHSLESLVDLCLKLSNDFEDIIGECEYLNPFGVQPRYPFGLELSEEDAMTSAQKCELIIKFIRTKIVFND